MVTFELSISLLGCQDVLHLLRRVASYDNGLDEVVFKGPPDLQVEQDGDSFIDSKGGTM